MKYTAMKLSAFLLAILFAISGLQLSISAAGRSIDGFSGNTDLEDTFSIGQSGNFRDLEVRPGDEIRIPLTADMFTWSDGRTPLPLEAVSISELSKGKARVKTKVQYGSEVLDYVQLDTHTFSGKPFYASGSTLHSGKTAYISVMFAENVVSVKEQDFNFDIYITVNGERYAQLEISLQGRMGYESVDVDEDTDSVNLSEGFVAEASAYAPSVKVDAGNGITIDKNMFKDKKYYAISSIKDSVDRISEEYPEIYTVVAAVYKLETINMRDGKSDVTIVPKTDDDTVKEDYYVYGEDMSYLGTTAGVLAYSDVYVLTTQLLPTFEDEKYQNELTNAPTTDRASE